VTEQLPLASVHVVLLKLPLPVCEKVTVPAGVEAPAPEASLTVAVQVEPTPARTVLGRQLTEVLELLLLTVTLNVPELPAYPLLPPSPL